jgi:hypothetical protein
VRATCSGNKRPSHPWDAAQMISRAPTLAEWPYRMVRLTCDLCSRRGHHRKETLIVGSVATC